LTAASIYLGIGLWTLKSANAIIPTNIHGQPLVHFNEFGEEEVQMCDIDTNKMLKYFVEIVLVPVLLLRIVAFIKYYKKDTVDFAEYSNYLSWIFNGLYGSWTVHHVVKYMGLSRACRDLRCLSLVNYELALIFGCFPAVNVLFMTVVFIILVPVFLW